MTTSWNSPRLIAHARIMADSFQRWTGVPIISPCPDGPVLARALFEAPFVLVSHGLEADPLLNYGNRAALRLWVLDWSELIGMPSRQTAEPMHRDERARLLAEVAEHGYSDNYSGIRIASSGRRFRIRNALVWNLVDAAGEPRGQAARFADWEYLD